MEVEDMAIEPLGSIMSVQAQPAQKVEPIQPVASTEASIQAEKAPDLKTAIINEVSKKDDGNANDGRQNQTNNEQIKQAVEKLNKSMVNSEAIFGIHEKTNRVTIKIVDKESKKVIKELPPEKTLDMIAKVWEMAGILVDEKR